MKSNASSPLRIYFCGSIRGGRELAALYAEMIARLQSLGAQVLTEHVGDPALTNKGGDGGSSYIYERDTAWLRECDIVIAECTVPSLGVGYELAYAEALGKPVYVFYGGEEGRLSAMIEGDPRFVCRYYRGKDELMNALEELTEALRA